jgi:hypothetical protein
MRRLLSWIGVRGADSGWRGEYQLAPAPHQWPSPEWAGRCGRVFDQGIRAHSFMLVPLP